MPKIKSSGTIEKPQMSRFETADTRGSVNITFLELKSYLLTLKLSQTVYLLNLIF